MTKDKPQNIGEVSKNENVSLPTTHRRLDHDEGLKKTPLNVYSY